MFNLGAGEVLVILLIALIVLGPDKLPDAARKAGNVMAELRRMSNGFQRELQQAMDAHEPAPSKGPAGATETEQPPPSTAQPTNGARPRRREPLRAERAQSKD